MRMRAWRRGSIWLLSAVALLVGACGGGGGSGTPASTSSAQTSSAPAYSVKLATKTVDGKSQAILVDAKGMTLYYFTPDKGGTVTCTAACLQNWPPLLLPSGVSSPSADKGVTGKLGTVPNPQGGTQVTYNAWPLYYYAKDKDAGDVYGQGVGGKWFVVPPDLASSV